MSIFPSLFGRKTNKPAAASQDPMSLDIWDACEGFSFATTTLALPTASAAVSMDWKETADHHVFLADFPGVKKEEVSIEVEEEKVLKISAQRAKVSEEKGDKWHRLERNHDKFFRSIRLPQDANTEEMKAKLENGVLVVTVPKKQDKKAQTRLVQIAG
ncbi:18.1 kDa class I heat shock protein-like [Zingiber officinale]|uniref:18.1 kDa class I heat shock protein-like n=1 Tax=Zingiber officinale TaxID=94328 RepID=UPI001C4ACF26|nr:18.1 kDa class I heat shock protein-like [Zingiber officinale]